jgi:hypothetical protein
MDLAGTWYRATLCATWILCKGSLRQGQGIAALPACGLPDSGLPAHLLRKARPGVNTTRLLPGCGAGGGAPLVVHRRAEGAPAARGGVPLLPRGPHARPLPEEAAGRLLLLPLQGEQTVSAAAAETAYCNWMCDACE